MDKTIDQALKRYWEEKLELTIRGGNLSYCMLEGYRHKEFDLAKNANKFNNHDGILWKGDLCLRLKILLVYIRRQPGY